jgi:uncharacterized protein (DUF849 family)
MSFSDPLIIELRANEHHARKADRPNLPYSPAEIIRDAREAAEAGAAQFHWHARDPETGEPSNDPELYVEVYREIRAGTDLIVCPTLGYVTQATVAERLRHMLVVQDDPFLRVDMAPIDMGSINVDLWDIERGAFRTRDVVYVNTTEHLIAMMTAFQEHGIPATIACWDVGQVRTGRLLQAAGLLRPTILWQLIFATDVQPQAAEPTLKGLEAMVEAVPAGQPWSVMCLHGDVLPLASLAIAMGGHVQIGLGDHPYSRFGVPRNADLVRHVVALARTLGREVATPAQAREILRLPQRTRFPGGDVAVQAGRAELNQQG